MMEPSRPKVPIEGVSPSKRGRKTRNIIVTGGDAQTEPHSTYPDNWTAQDYTDYNDKTLIGILRNEIKIVNDKEPTLNSLIAPDSDGEPEKIK